MMQLCVIFCCLGVLASLVSQQLTTASEASPRSLQDRPKTAHDAPRMRVSEGSLRRHNRSPNKPKRRSKCVTWRTRTFRATELVVKLWPLSTLLSALCSLFTPLILLAVRGPGLPASCPDGCPADSLACLYGGFFHLSGAPCGALSV